MVSAVGIREAAGVSDFCKIRCAVTRWRFANDDEFGTGPVVRVRIRVCYDVQSTS
jgi:hypothetical protein